MFTTESGRGPLTDSAMRKSATRAGETAGIEFPVHPHMLRHACGFSWPTRGMTPGRSNITSDIETFSTPCDTPSWRPSGSRGSGWTRKGDTSFSVQRPPKPSTTRWRVTASPWSRRAVLSTSASLLGSFSVVRLPRELALGRPPHHGDQGDVKCRVLRRDGTVPAGQGRFVRCAGWELVERSGHRAGPLGGRGYILDAPWRTRC
jgi:hypothetical protein